MPFIHITSLLVGLALGIVLGGLGIIAVIRAADFIEGPLGAAALADAERHAVAADRHDIAIQIHDTRAELGYRGGA